MSTDPSAAAHDHDHDHAHDHHGHSHGDVPRTRGFSLRVLLALFLVLLALLAASNVLVKRGTAVVVTRFGDPVRVLNQPGPNWKWPAPFERSSEVDLRLRTTSSGIHDVGTQDGLRVLVQAWVAWQVDEREDGVRLFLRSVRNQPEEAARQLRTFLGSALETATIAFPLDSLLNTDASKLRLADYEKALRERLEKQALEVYGIQVREIGIERLTLPAASLEATLERMKSERNTVAETRQAQGRKQAGEIRSGAEKEARILKAEAEELASQTESKARAEAAEIYAKAYSADPQLYAFLRSLDTLDQAITTNTRLVLRTDAAPFRALVEGTLVPEPPKK